MRPQWREGKPRWRRPGVQGTGRRSIRRGLVSSSVGGRRAFSQSRSRARRPHQIRKSDADTRQAMHRDACSPSTNNRRTLPLATCRTGARLPPSAVAVIVSRRLRRRSMHTWTMPLAGDRRLSIGGRVASPHVLAFGSFSCFPGARMSGSRSRSLWAGRCQDDLAIVTSTRHLWLSRRGTIAA